MARSFTVALGALSAGQATAISLDDYRFLPRTALIERAVVRNDSDSALTFANLPGSPQCDPGERPEVEVGGRSFVVQAVGTVNDNEVRVTVQVVGD